MTTVQAAAARRVSSQLDTLRDFDYEPTHHELEPLYVTEVLVRRLDALLDAREALAPRYREIGLRD